MAYLASKGIQKIAYLEKFIAPIVGGNLSSDDSYAYGWGRKPSYFRAERYAQKHQLKAVCLEDGFIRSLGLGKQGYPPLSLVVDQQGIYFDAHMPSDLEDWILKPESKTFNQRAQHCIELILKNGITKYNQKHIAIPSMLFAQNKNILVVDQTFGDQSIHYAGATESSFTQMLKQAQCDHPEATIWIKTHPDVLAGKSNGYFSAEQLHQHNVRLLIENYNPIELMQYIDEVYVVSSQLGFEALLCQKKVHCFGVPWYAGWGLTDDRYAPIHLVKQRRTQARSLFHLFSSAYLHYARYVSPITGQRCELEEILQLLICNVQKQKLFPQDVVLYGFSPWKRQFMRSYLDFSHINIQFRKWRMPKKDQHVIAWGKKAYLLRQKKFSHVTTVEDGFIRSVGLGAALIRPCSLVFDDVGIYYDATRPSRIEQLFNQYELSSDDLQQAERLKAQLIALNISKYNVGEKTTLQRPTASQKVILVIGQVEDDMSVQLGGVDIKTNLALLKTVRENHPDTYIIYKPHPDVEADLRVGKIEDSIALQYANSIERYASILNCFEIIDEVHTLTSLTGFEALVREIPVYCYGLPFYAGWGLTTDRHLCDRRKSKISLNKLIFIALIKYPSYNLPVTSKMRIPLVSAHKTVDYIQEQISLKTVNSSYSFWGYLSKLQKLKK